MGQVGAPEGIHISLGRSHPNSAKRFGRGVKLPRAKRAKKHQEM